MPQCIALFSSFVNEKATHFNWVENVKYTESEIKFNSRSRYCLQVEYTLHLSLSLFLARCLLFLSFIVMSDKLFFTLTWVKRLHVRWLLNNLVSIIVQVRDVLAEDTQLVSVLHRLSQK